MDMVHSLHYYREIMNQTRDIILIIQEDGTIIDANNAALKAYGYTLPELKTLTIENLSAPHAIAKLTAEGLLETKHARKNSSSFPVEVDAHPLATGHLLVNIRDITAHSQIRESLCRELESIKYSQQELLARNITLERLASTDKLTGLWNRRYFENAALYEIERACRYTLALSLILFDIDYFKHLNDNFGHQTGDELLIMVARLISAELRTNDVFARWGGDEFVIMLPNTDASAAEQTAEKIRSIIENCKASPAGMVTLSIGVAEYRINEALSTFIKRADDALYLAKKSGRNAVNTA